VNRIPPQRDASLLRRMDDTRSIQRHHLSGVIILSGKPTIVEHLRQQVLGKSEPYRRASRIVAGSRELKSFVDTNLVLADGPRHGQLRSIASSMWNEHADQMIDAISSRVVGLLRDLECGGSTDLGGTFGRQVAAAVLEEILDLDPGTRLVNSLIELAPRLNALAAAGLTTSRPPDLETLAADCAIIHADLRRAVDGPGSGRLYGLMPGLRTARGVSRDEAASIAVFTATAAVETLRSFVVSCVVAAGSSRDAGQILREAPPVPLTFYSAEDGLELDGEVVSRNDLILINNQSLSFGVGRHACIGARIAMCCGTTIIDDMNSNRLEWELESPPEWDDDKFVRTMQVKGRIVRR